MLVRPFLNMEQSHATGATDHTKERKGLRETRNETVSDLEFGLINSKRFGPIEVHDYA